MLLKLHYLSQIWMCIQENIIRKGGRCSHTPIALYNIVYLKKNNIYITHKYAKISIFYSDSLCVFLND